MYPNAIIGNITLYDICFSGGIIAALVCFRLLADKIGMSAKLFNYCLAIGVAAIIGGGFSSVLFQAIYNYEHTGVFEITRDTGMTFYGGLIGGVVVFVGLFFALRRIFIKDEPALTRFFELANIAACSIVIAHAIGRIGCLMAGCCHGLPTDSPLGIYMEYAGEKVLPVQLYESLFLFALFAFLLWRVFAGKKFNLEIYMTVYGVWRFFIEYLRGDERGGTFIPFLSPSQLTALLLIVGGVLLFLAERGFYRRSVAKDDE